MLEIMPQARSGSVPAADPSSPPAKFSYSDTTSAVQLVETLIERARTTGASDIHIDPTFKHVRVRLRTDGVLQDFSPLPRSIHLEVISRIKILAALRTDEHAIPQDGRFRHYIDDANHLDIRVSIVPTYHGENAVLRLLVPQRDDKTLSSLGFLESDRRKIERALRKTTGLILATGPTGSGKTTTLYTLIKMLATPEISLITIEDPIEYSMDAVKQIQVNPRAGLSFAQGLRSILRQDPDVIMVGEIRDPETAGIAVNTALTGHLVLSTLHTNDAVTTLPRLTDMGIDPYLVAATMNIAIAQRLLRTVCTLCVRVRSLSTEEQSRLIELGIPSVKIGTSVPEQVGCESCNGTGYTGRISINEVLVAEGDIREAIRKQVSADEMRTIARATGMTTMLEDGFRNVREGRTTLEELFRVIHE